MAWDGGREEGRRGRERKRRRGGGGGRREERGGREGGEGKKKTMNKMYFSKVEICIQQVERLPHEKTYLIRNGHASSMARESFTKATPVGEKGGQEQAMRCKMEAVSSLARYI